MPRVAVVKPEKVRYPLKEGDWVELKKYLTLAETKGLQGSGLSGIRNPDAVARRSYELDFVRLGLGRLEAYVLDWSFIGLDGKALKCTPESIADLPPDIAAEIDEVLDTHVEAMEKEKNGVAPEPAGAPN